MIKAIEALRRDGRSLAPVSLTVQAEVDALVPGHAVIDPERPLDPRTLVQDLLAHEDRRPVARRLTRWVIFMAWAAALLALWLATPLREWMDGPALVASARGLGTSPVAPLLAVLIFVAGSLVFFPFNAMVVLSVIALGPVSGAGCALIGGLCGASVTYEIGRRIGRDTLHHWLGARFHHYSRRFRTRGLLAILAVRLLPVAPFTLVNLLAGAANVRRVDFIAGTLLGIVPGVILAALVVDSAIAALREPRFGNYLVFVVAAITLVGATVMMQRWLSRRLRRSEGR
ncbi:TVP38/TMEM64 family protein [Tahibacter amnicola]|uniref:TVP38/TMEM64 family membrane protein n=1 Tax=Tahibacter amnicola TaxID=2976241 RepID=A0ABY6BAK5_9GAMM|nr:VTT domain-containing protein [Tahibacter amnicola]UXI66556.1 VTT domain-containing protein [Tahibacter amnicola]